MDVHRASEDLARTIAEGWLHTERNYFVFAPPLNRSSRLFELLRDPQKALGRTQAAETLAVAFCPHGMFRSAVDLATRTCEEWKVFCSVQHNYQRSLEYAVTEVTDSGRIPVLILPGFHRIVLDLPEELGSCLRDLNQHAGLRCVAEVPLRWKTMVERWRNEGRRGLIGSGFGQGYTDLPLHGYDSGEIRASLAKHGLSERFEASIVEITGGFHFWVETLISEVEQNTPPPSWTELLLGSNEFQSFLNYLDAAGSSANRDALGRIFHGIGSVEDHAAIEGHDWVEFLLQRDGTLRSSAIGAGCARSLGLRPTQSLGRMAFRLIRGGSYQQAQEVIEQARQTEGPLRRAWLVSRILEVANSGADEWATVVRMLSELERTFPVASNGDNATVTVKVWKEFCSTMLACSKARRNANPDPIGHLCGRGGFSPNPLCALRLIAMRLAWAEKISSPLLATQAILVIPEVLVQVYCAIRLDLRYWESPPLDPVALAEIRKLPYKDSFEWPPPNLPMGFGQLIVIGWHRMSLLDPELRLVTAYKEVETLQQLYAQDRNPLAHRLTFSNKAQWKRYARQSRDLLARIASILVPEVPVAELSLPVLEALLDEINTEV